mgnify:CR=1 FL=1
MDRDRRTVLRTLAVSGGLGLAGCLALSPEDPGSEPTDTDVRSTARTTDQSELITHRSPPASSTARRTESRTPTPNPPSSSTPASTSSSTPTPVVECLRPPDELDLFELTESRVTAGETTTVTGRVENPYIMPLDLVELGIEPPGGAWDVRTPTSFRGIERLGTRPFELEVTAPESASGEYEIAIHWKYPSESRVCPMDSPIHDTVTVRVE